MYGIKTSDAPIVIEPLVIKNGLWEDSLGVRHSRAAFRNPVFRLSNSIVEVVEPDYNHEFQFAGDVTGWTYDGTRNVYVEDRVISFKNMDSIKAKLKQKIQQYADGVEQGGFVYNTMPFPSNEKTALRISRQVAISANGKPARATKVIPLYGNPIKNYNAGQFKAFTEAFDEHFKLTENAMFTHMANVDALTTVQEIIDYQYGLDGNGDPILWPVNPEAPIL